MTAFGVTGLQDLGLYELAELRLSGSHQDRILAANINWLAGKHCGGTADVRGDVHLNYLLPGAVAGNHYHLRVFEYFVNLGPVDLELQLRHSETGETAIVVMPPPSRSRMPVFRPKHKVAHAVLNRADCAAVLLIIVDADQPEDVKAMRSA